MKQWIWNFGDFEIYHNMLLHNRRQQYGHREPVTWKLYAPEPVVRFKKKFTTEGGLIRMRACGIFTAILIGEHSYEKYAGQEEIWIPAGTWEILIVVENTDTFPCVIVDGVVQSDDSWLCDDMTGSWGYAGTSSLLTSFEHTPEEFPFQYEEVLYN